jgi:hypothetical protein
MGDEHKYLLIALDSKLAKVEDKQDRLLEVVSEQNEILARMQVIQQNHHDSLEEHHRRTTLNESRLLLLEKRDHQFQSFIKGAVWIMGLLVSGITFFFHFLK